MPKSKRNKQVELAKTKKRGLEWKKGLFEEVRSSVDKYENVFVFSVNDMRNSKMKNVREQWKHSRFFIGKNKIMAMALGRFAEEEYKPNLHKLGQQIKGQRGLLFSNKSVEEVLSWLRSYSEGDYARSGNTATETVHLSAGPLTMFPHNLEPYLRQLGLPTSLEKGVIHLIKDHEVCKTGDILTPDTAKIVKLLGYEMAEFQLTINCVWSQDGSFMQFTESVDTGSKENKKQPKRSSLVPKPTVKNNSLDSEIMEVDLNSEGSPDVSEDEGIEVVGINETPVEDDDDVEFVSETKIIPVSNIVSVTSTPKEKANNVIENSISDLPNKSNKSVKECEKKEASAIIDNDLPSTIEKNTQKSHLTFTANTPKNANKDKVEEESLMRTPEVNEMLLENNAAFVSDIKLDTDDTSVSNTVFIASPPKEIIKNSISDLPNGSDKSIKECEMDEALDAIDNKPSSSMIEENIQNTKKSRTTAAKTPKTAKKKDKARRESLMKTPDANTSQDSPVFRELRTRSVKISRKKK